MAPKFKVGDTLRLYGQVFQIEEIQFHKALKEHVYITSQNGVVITKPVPCDHVDLLAKVIK